MTLYLMARSAVSSNVGRGKRIASATVGGTLAVLGLKRRSLAGTALALAGGWLAYRGLRSRSRGAGASGDATTVERSIIVGRPADELYEIWRDAGRLGEVVEPFADVVSTGEDRQRWAFHAPRGRNVSWNERLVEDRPGELLHWESEEGAPVSSEWSVRFRPASDDRGTEVTLRWRFDPPGGALGDAAMGVLGIVPDALVRQALDRFKSLAETGEIPTLERNPSARGQGDLV